MNNPVITIAPTACRHVHRFGGIRPANSVVPRIQIPFLSKSFVFEIVLFIGVPLSLG